MKKDKTKHIIIGEQGRGVELIYTQVTDYEYSRILKLCQIHNRPINILRETATNKYILCAKEILSLNN